MNQKKNQSGETEHNRNNQNLFWFKKILADELYESIVKSSKFKKIILKTGKKFLKNPRKIASEIVRKNFKEDLK